MTISAIAETHTRQAIEKWLITTWSELLETPDIDTSSDFFDLGANSLTVIKLLSRIEKIYGENVLPVDTLFVESQLSQVAASIYSAVQSRQ